MDVTVLGSLNFDIVLRCEALPLPGETVLCDRLTGGPGGKGLNQAVAASRAGARTRLRGAVGSDANGEALLGFLDGEDVDTTGIAIVPDAPTGVAHIAIDRQGENSIIVVSGANRAVPVSRLAEVDASATIWLAQLEMPIAAVEAFLRQGRRAGATTILNAAPADETARCLFEDADIIVMNEHELAQFSGDACLADNEALIEQAARKVMTRKDQILIITLGANGTRIVDAKTSCRVAASRVPVVDTTGAGDCFCGVLAASFAQGLSLLDAVRRANLAAAIAVGRPGAALAMPHKAEIDVRSNA